MDGAGAAREAVELSTQATQQRRLYPGLALATPLILTIFRSAHPIPPTPGHLQWLQDCYVSGQRAGAAERAAQSLIPCATSHSPCVQDQVTVLSGCLCPINCPQIAPSGLSRQEFFAISPHVEMLKDP